MKRLLLVTLLVGSYGWFAYSTRQMMAPIPGAAAAASPQVESASATPPAGVKWRDSFDGVRSFLVFEPNSPKITDDYMRSVAGRYDFAWAPRRLHLLRAANSQMIMGIYSSALLPDGQEAWVDQNHPEWVLHKCDRKTKTEVIPGKHALDITNPSVIDFKVNQALKLTGNLGNSGALAWDNYFLSSLEACGVWHKGEWIQKFNGKTDYSEITDPAWTDAMIAYAGAVKKRLSSLANPVRLIPNTQDSKILRDDAARLQRFIDNIDGNLMEGGHYNPNFVGDRRSFWLKNLKYVEMMQAAGKAVYSIEYPYNVPGGAISKEFILFTLGSYLLAKNRSSGLSIPSHDGGRYLFEMRWHAEFDAANAIGYPCGERREITGSNSEDGTWVREYARGFVAVNASNVKTSNKTTTVTLPAGLYKDLYGSSVQSPVTLAPTSGAVFLKSGTASCAR